VSLKVQVSQVAQIDRLDPPSGKIGYTLTLDSSYWSSGPFMVGVIRQFNSHSAIYVFGMHLLSTQSESLHEIWAGSVKKLGTFGGGEGYRFPAAMPYSQ
jgi:hypothetical protein